MIDKIKNLHLPPMTVNPFLKWAGGKRWLATSAFNIFPKKYGRYIEPFLGGGAVFFKALPQNALLSDLNSDLTCTYQAIQTDWKAVQEKLEIHHQNHSNDYYYETRDKVTHELFAKAARFIYLNRTCWNGLYRVNQKGEFNVPRGSKNTVIFDPEEFRYVSEKLKNSVILNQDFEASVSTAKAGDFLYLDPPYTVNHNLNGFLKYNEKIFSWNDQVRLRDAAVEASKRGAMITISNANHESIWELYKGFFEIQVIERMSVISGKVSGRGNTSELLIKSGWG